jgi:fructose-bisphosphate aldolase class I
MSSELRDIAKKLVAPGKGILAADESFPTIEKRFSKINVESNEETRRSYREILFTTEGIEEYISGVILFDETIHQRVGDGTPFTQILTDKGIIPGIKVDKGKIDMPEHPGEKITQGLEDLGERLGKYYEAGARFTKWRVVFTIGEGIPTDDCIIANSETLAEFAVLSQKAGMVPIVEPEVLMDGNHDIRKCREVTYQVLKMVFVKLVEKNAELSGLLLKPNMVIQGKDHPEKSTAEEIAESTLKCFREAVPPEVPGVVFLSGGQGPEEATQNLNALNVVGGVDWELSFSFGRALQAPVLDAWAGSYDNKEVAQKALLKRAKLNSAARFGKYNKKREDKNGG